MNRLSHFFVLFLFTCQLSAQPWFSKSIDVENQNNVGWQIMVEGEELIFTSPNFCDTTYSNWCTILARTDWEGNLLGYAKIEGHRTASSHDSFIKSTDSTYHLYCRPSPLGSNNVQIIELDNNLEIIQEWEFGSELENEIPFYWVQHEGGFLTCALDIEDGQYVTWLTLLDEEMEIVHQASFPEQETEYASISSDGLLATQDNHFVGTGRAVIGVPDAQGVTKFDKNLEVVWHTRIERIHNPANDDATIVELMNGDIVMNWETENTTNPYNDSLSSSFVRMINLEGSSGDTLWSTILWMPKPSYPFIHKLNRAKNGDIIGVGHMYQPAIPEEWAEHQGWNHSGFVFRMSPTGELKWKRYILDAKSPLADFGHFLDSEELPNGDLLFTGAYYDTFPNADPFINDINIWLVRTDSMGCLTPGCGELQIVNADGTVLTSTEEAGSPNKEALEVRVYPNPAREHWMLDWRYPEEAHLQVTDVQGRVLYEQLIRSGPQKIPAQGLPSGLYFFNIQSERRSGSLRVMKIR
jgi:hypothetical protein